MTSLNNIASAIIILGVLYLHQVYGLNGLIAFLLLLFAVVTSTMPTGGDEQKDLLRAKSEFYRARSRYYDSKRRSESFGKEKA